MIRRLSFLVGVMGLLVGCGLQPETEEGAVLTVVPPTPTLSAITETPLPDEVAIMPPTATVVLPTATRVPATATTPAGSDDGTVEDDAPAGTHQVIFVEPDDSLNVRSSPGTESEIVGAIPAGASNITLDSYSRRPGLEQWASITYNDLTGWVNTAYLTEQVQPTTFCQANTPQTLIEDFRQALTNQDNTTLSGLFNPGRGLRVHRHWWNPVVTYSGAELDTLLTNTTIHNWGVSDGEGAPITGTFSDIPLPLLQYDLLPASETGCNEIISGGTAGWIRLPDGYETINYYSLHRPYTEHEFDWGTWVIGIEQWQGDYYISYLIHYQWEI